MYGDIRIFNLITAGFYHELQSDYLCYGSDIVSSCSLLYSCHFALWLRHVLLVMSTLFLWLHPAGSEYGSKIVPLGHLYETCLPSTQR